MLYCTVTTIGCYETNSDCMFLWCEHTQWLACNHAYAINAREFYATPWIPSRKMSRGSLVMNYSWVKLTICGLIIFTVVTDQHSAAISVQAVDDVGYSLGRGAGKARFNVATPTYEARTRPLHVQHTYYRIIFKQNPFNIISREVQGCTSTDFRLK